MHEKKRLFTYVDSWADSGGYYAVMPVEYANEDCYIVLDSNGYFGIYRNAVTEPFMEEDMLLTGNINDNLDYEIRTWLRMLTILRDMWRR